VDGMVHNIKPPVSSKEPMIDGSTQILKNAGSDEGNFLIENGSENGIHEITNMMRDLSLNRRYILKTGFCFLGAMFVGLKMYKKLKLIQTFQNSLSATSYAANCLFYPINPFVV
jgi:hypothetical protein